MSADYYHHPVDACRAECASVCYSGWFDRCGYENRSKSDAGKPALWTSKKSAIHFFFASPLPLALSRFTPENEQG